MTELKDILDAVTAFIPEKYRALTLLGGLALLKYSPFITRSVYALMNGRGIKGVLAAIWLGTNTPKKTQQETAENAEKQNTNTNTTP